MSGGRGDGAFWHGTHLHGFEAGVGTVSFGLALFWVLFVNSPFWAALTLALGGVNLHNFFLLVSVFVVLTTLITMLVSLLGFRYVFKPVVAALLVISAAVSYFMDSYGVMFDRHMLQNVLQTDYNEAVELLSPGLFFKVGLVGVLPALVVLSVKINFDSLMRELQKKAALIFLGTLVTCAAIFPFYKEYTFVGRNNSYLRYMVVPANYIGAAWSTIRRSWRTRPVALLPVGIDAHLTDRKPESKKNLVVMVVGETARASSFSIYGYGRPTTPLLADEEIISFDNFYSCGTATAISLPCMFSHLERDDFSTAKASRYENLLDVLDHAGIATLWRENNSGCKGVCKRTETEELHHLAEKRLCPEGECYDEILLEGLQDYVDGLEGDAFVVLHQQGSHGPAYFKRHPKEMTLFNPECTQSELQECGRQEIVNAYDNTIAYTDFFLKQVIDFLNKNSKEFNSAMLYVSDHGESLGENNIYLHGLPYFIAPDEQKHVPFLTWLSPGFGGQSGIDPICLEKHSGGGYSHDNLFHSVLGMMGVETEIYNPSLDIFRSCRN